MADFCRNLSFLFMLIRVKIGLMSYSLQLARKLVFGFDVRAFISLKVLGHGTEG